ncbi:MAG: aminotransferase class I/II-fold pyridoxal phosphate-dependent enzyme [Chloroflexi bacterium]|nr:aminotransferase class I/II-fold pyridoxal phosphate-dependent enzyme [Chloroflexota bacterium]
MVKLAIDGGIPVRSAPLQGGFHGSAAIDQTEINAVTNVLKKKRLFRFLGDEQESEAAQVEAWYKARLGRQHALAVNGGTAALICAMYGLDLGPGDEVIIPAHTYVATAAAVIAAGAVPVIAEIDNSLNIDPSDVEKKITPYTKAIVPVHMRGIPARMAEIMAISEKHGIPVIEDVAQANGGSYRGKYLGSMGKVGCFSFQQYKIITSGEGGIFVTDDQDVYYRGRMQHDCAIGFWPSVDKTQHDYAVSGENYRISELAASLVLTQCGRLDSLLSTFRATKKRITQGVKDIKGLALQDVPDPEGDCGIAFVFFAPTPDLAKRLSAALNAENIRCGTIYDNTIPDRHIYANWPFMTSGKAEIRRMPWMSPYYKGSVRNYTREQCPQSLGYLERAVMMFIDQFFTAQDADQVVEAITKVASALL